MTDQPRPDDEAAEPERTIIRPASTPVPAAPAAEVASAPRLGNEPERTIIQTGPSSVSSAPSAAPQSAPAPGFTSLTGGMAPMAPRTDGARIQTGDVLNHIFEVKRFIARGGMGEVFEGINVNSDERVAIKVILPQLAADPNVQAMFRKEARTLTRLSHPALVQYRVLAQEPQLGVFYIVTEFIDGANLSSVLGELKPSADDLRALTRRLAEGLAAAHALGAIHRDISPDNVLLESGRLELAKIIDFGIAKDLDPGSKTIIGDGFAGKLGYVAPEQLGDFNKQVGPWSDVYSLALVILACAQGKNVDMGSSFVDAIDRRRKGADTSVAPAEIRGVLERMLTPDPSQRIRSMEEVVAALATSAGAKPQTETPRAKEVASHSAAPGPKGKPKANNNLMLIGGAALALVVGGGAWFALSFDNETDPSPVSAEAADGAGVSTGAIQIAVAQALPTLPCTWLSLAGVSGEAGRVNLAFTGVAGRPADAEAAISRVVSSSGARIGATDFSDVAPISGTECDSIDAFRQIRAIGANHLSVAQRSFEMRRLADGDYAGKIGARAVIDLNIAPDITDFAIYGLEPSGAISPLIPNRALFDSLPKNGFPIADLGGGRYRLQPDLDHSGWSGILLLTGQGGFSDDLLVAGAGVRTAGWRERFLAEAATGGWKAEMVWFKTVDEIPDN